MQRKQRKHYGDFLAVYFADEFCENANFSLNPLVINARPRCRRQRDRQTWKDKVRTQFASLELARRPRDSAYAQCRCGGSDFVSPTTHSHTYMSIFTQHFFAAQFSLAHCECCESGGGEMHCATSSLTIQNTYIHTYVYAPSTTITAALALDRPFIFGC